MIKTITSNSDLAITGDNLFGAVEFVFKGRKKSNLLAIVADESNDNIKIYFRDKEKGGYQNTAGTKTPEVITLRTGSGLADSAAAELIDAINGLPKNSGAIKAANGNEYLLYGVNGVAIPTFTFSSTAVSVAAPVGPTLASATVGANFTYTITKDADADVSLTKTGVIATATDALTFTDAEIAAEGFVATDVCTITVSLSVPSQPNSVTTVTASATLTA